MWVLLNLNRQQWGDEFYETEAEAHAELKSFWKGVSGVNIKKWTVEKLPVSDAKIHPKTAAALAIRQQKERA